MPRCCSIGWKKPCCPLLGEPHQMAESMLELWWAMQPLTMFTNAEVLEDALSLHWVKITSSQTSKPADPPTSQEQSCSRNQRASDRGMFMVAHSVGHSKPTATAVAVSPSPIPSQKVESQQEETSGWQWTPPPGFTEIARSLFGDDPPHEVAGIPPELAEEQGPIWIAGSTMFSTRLIQDAVSGSTYIDMMTCSMSLVVLLPQWVTALCPPSWERRTQIPTRPPTWQWSLALHWQL